ncbi:cytochrome P450-dit2 [Metarhizium acridum]|uniref:cytochrome P450-dit2 n=1 Tax=Metarhizium acridum TaxID=92637 RepID=UPI001C6B5C6F|nr:cytochrome P450-dit2 [Metarhizium acridum]
MPLVKDVDQQEIFNKYIEKPLRKHGAAKIFFAGQWNVLIHKPEYIAEVFRREDIYQKSGNHKKIPHSVLAALLGDNIISSRGESWKGYRRVIKPTLQASPNLEVLLSNARLLSNILVESQALATEQGIQASIQRHTIANFGNTYFNVNLNTPRSSEACLHRIQAQISKEIFSPVFMNFPFLDRLPFPSRKRARKLASHFTDRLVVTLEDGVKGDKTADIQNKLCTSLLSARVSGELTEKQFRDNTTILFMAGQENPQLAILSTMYLLAKHQDIQDHLFDELSLQREKPVDAEYLHSLPLLTSTIYESLRLFPPIGQLINRRVSSAVRLGDAIFIPQGTYVGYNCYSTNRDPDAWGQDANDFRPSRWGCSRRDIQKEYRRRRASAEFISFHGGQRACLGEQYAILQLKATLYTLVTRLRWRLDPMWLDRMTPAGPLYPRNLRLLFEERAVAPTSMVVESSG